MIRGTGVLEAEAILEIEGLWKYYGDALAVAGLNLRVLRGEVHGLLGPNGAGKTTTVKCIVGLLKPDRGTIQVGGRRVGSDPGYKALIGYLPEEPSLPDYLTPEELLSYVARIRGVEAAAQAVERLLKLFGLWELRGELIAGLSRGLRQRLALAAAFIHDPELIILDEPFLGLDPEGQRLVKKLVKDLAKRGGAALISTHMLDTAERFCDSATIIHQGRDVARGSIEELKKMAGLEGSAPLEEAFLRIVGGSEK